MESIKQIQIPVDSIKIAPEDVIQFLGCNKSNCPESLLEIIQQELKIYGDFIKPTGGYVIFTDHDVIIDSDYISIGNIIFNSGTIITSQLVGSEMLGALVVSAGPLVTERSQKLIQAGSQLEGYIVDAIGSLAVEKTADFVQSYLEDQIYQIGLKLTNSLSPGYCGWDVSEQFKLFSLLPDNFCGVRINESCLMIPIKSISAIIGIGRNVEKVPYPCSSCSIDICHKRK